MIKKYYYFMPNGYEKAAGIITSPNRAACPRIFDGVETTISNEFTYELQDGKFCAYHMGPQCVNLVNDKLKEILENHGEKEYLEFIPVIIKSKEYGDRQYFIVHFKKIYDVIDMENTVYGPAGNIIKLRVDYSKVKDLNFFNSQPIINDLNISAKVYKEIKKRKLNFGTSFGIIYCLNMDKYVTKV